MRKWYKILLIFGKKIDYIFRILLLAKNPRNVETTIGRMFVGDGKQFAGGYISVQAGGYISAQRWKEAAKLAHGRTAAY